MSPKLDPAVHKILVPEFKDDHANEWEQRYRGFMRDVEGKWDAREVSVQSGDSEGDEHGGLDGTADCDDGRSSKDEGNEPCDGESRLVEGHFWYVDTVAMRTLVKVRYRKGRWRVVGSLFRMV